MPLSNENPGMMDTFSQSKFEHLSLKAPLKEILKSQTQHVIKFHFTFIQYTNTHQSSQ